jgi:Metal binding domain of Ada
MTRTLTTRILARSARPKPLDLTHAHGTAFQRTVAEPKRYRLIGPDGCELLSETPGTLGGHRRNKLYGRLDCPSALRWLAKGHIVKQRVFFADEATAIAAGYRPCAVCLPEEYRRWKAATGGVSRSRRPPRAAP